MTAQTQTTNPEPIEETVTIKVTRFGNGKMRQIELSKKEWSLTRENLDRWLFTEVRI